MRFPFGAVAVLLVLVYATRVTAQPPRLATHLLTHNRIEIARPAAAIWPYIVDYSEWKQRNRLVHSSGPAGAVGEVFAAFARSEPKDFQYFVENVELVPNHRRTIKLYGRDGMLIGFATFTLVESSGHTEVAYDVYTESLLPPERAKQLTVAEVAELEREARETNSTRFDAELAALKRLVEEARRGER